MALIELVGMQAEATLRTRKSTSNNHFSDEGVSALMGLEFAHNQQNRYIFATSCRQNVCSSFA